jgi:hypothetical protein
MQLLVLATVLTTMAHAAAATPSATQSSGEAAAAAPADPPVVHFDPNVLTAASVLPVDSLLGREVALRELRVDEVASRGFWVTANAGAARFFVVPAEGELIEVAPGDTVNIHGDVRLLPEDWRRRQATLTGAGRMLVYAYTVRPAHAVRP